ncbi:MAG: tRNA (adenosine(37)-N6)-threonylcarbamoyltransferase complex transferase subunit TsaD [Bacteroidetes bacterium]|nr:MAG: tRNA (adenosine(37)-N6)-threonylcarbamoyltransferase complex transferase subunit TsaD [Bacteroidota bacterium]
MKQDAIILGIESSCDDTSAAVLRGTRLLSNLIATQKVHESFGGVVPELASRAHLSNIVPVVSEALKQAEVEPEDLDAIAFTRGPGLLGALLVGTSFAKGLSLATGARLIEVNHLQGHILSPFLTTDEATRIPTFPFLSLLVSGGHTQIILVRGPLDMEILGNTIDDAAGEAFDKCAKQIGLPYPGGPVIDHMAQEGNPSAFKLARPLQQGLDFSFSGLKTSFLYLVRDHLEKNPDFIEENVADLCASLQFTIIDILLRKLRKAIKQTGVKTVAIGGGVAANSGLRGAMEELAEELGLDLFLPERRFTTDNAAMIAIAGYFKHQAGLFSSQNIAPMPRMHV